MNVLIIEQDQAVAQHLSHIIHSQGNYATDLAANGEKALRPVLKKTFDLVLLSVQADEVSNLEIVAILRNMSPHAVICVLSNDADLHLPSEISASIDVILEPSLANDRITQLLGFTGQIHTALTSVQGLGTLLPAR